MIQVANRYRDRPLYSKTNKIVMFIQPVIIVKPKWNQIGHPSDLGPNGPLKGTLKEQVLNSMKKGDEKYLETFTYAFR